MGATSCPTCHPERGAHLQLAENAQQAVRRPKDLYPKRYGGCLTVQRTTFGLMVKPL
jgi:hypothetical protein